MIAPRPIHPFLAALLLAALASPVGAAPAPSTPPPPAKARQQLRQVRQALRERRAQLHSVKQQERRALRDLEEMDRRRDAAEADLRRLEVELRQTRSRAQATAASLAVVRTRLAGQRARVDGRLRDIYKWGRQGYVDLLLEAGDFSELVTRAHFLGAIMRADARLLVHYEADVQEYSRLYLQFVHQEEQIAALIRRRQPAGGPATLGGRFRGFLWPARGVFTSGYGMRYHPIFRIRRMHSGVDIAAPRSAPVVAAWDGTVLYTGWFGGYGKIVIIDHGDGLSTLYAHLSAILTRPGARVRKGQMVGRVGSTGFSTGPHVHFEIRVNGTPVNPVGL